MARLHRWIESGEGDKNLWLVRSLIWLVLNIALTYSITHTAYFLRRNQKGMPTIFPQFYPPQNISPLAVHCPLCSDEVNPVPVVEPLSVIEVDES